MRPISLVRFNAIAGYARQPMARRMAEELGWYEHSGRRVVGILIRDRTDDDFGGIVFAADAKLRFRSVNVVGWDDRRRLAEVRLRRAMEEAAHAEPSEHHQGDERGTPVDFFAYARPRHELSSHFVALAEQEGLVAARRIIEFMMRWYDDVDGNFVEQFQTTGFDQRIWELYLFAAFTEMGYTLDRRHPVPDYLLPTPYGGLAVEAVTVAPSGGGALGPPPKVDDLDQAKAFLREYMPIKFGSALYSKLQKRYWEKPNVDGKPLVFAIEDFSAPGSMIYTRSAIDVYLYGYDHDWEYDAAGKLCITPRKIDQHRWGQKIIPSGFFFQPDTEHVSAVLFSNSGTAAKFNRMGVVAGFGSPEIVLIREGTAVNHDPNSAEPVSFRHLVNDPSYRESWVEGLDVFHNPNALIQIPEDVFPGAAHHHLRDDKQRLSGTPEWHPLGSRTTHYVGLNVERVLTELQVPGGPAGAHF